MTADKLAWFLAPSIAAELFLCARQCVRGDYRDTAYPLTVPWDRAILGVVVNANDVERTRIPPNPSLWSLACWRNDTQASIGRMSGGLLGRKEGHMQAVGAARTGHLTQQNVSSREEIQIRAWVAKSRWATWQEFFSGGQQSLQRFSILMDTHASGHRVQGVQLPGRKIAFLFSLIHNVIFSAIVNVDEKCGCIGIDRYLRFFPIVIFL